MRDGPDRRLEGDWLGRGMGLRGASVRGIHLRLPGCGDAGPTLELFELGEPGAADERPVNRPGLMHIAFTVDDIHVTLDRLLGAGGSRLGEIAEAAVAGVGRADFVYARDPEGNIVELQAWR